MASRGGLHAQARFYQLWDLESGACLRTLEGHIATVQSVCVTPDAWRAISIGGNTYKRAYALRLWDLESGAYLRTLEEHTNWVNSVCVTPNGTRATSASRDKTLRLWDLDSGACLTVYHAGSPVRSAAFSMDGNPIFCGTSDGQMHFLRPVNFPPLGPPVVSAGGSGTSLTGTSLAIGMTNGRFNVPGAADVSPSATTSSAN